MNTKRNHITDMASAREVGETKSMASSGEMVEAPQASHSSPVRMKKPGKDMMTKEGVPVSPAQRENISMRESGAMESDRQSIKAIKNSNEPCSLGQQPRKEGQAFSSVGNAANASHCSEATLSPFVPLAPDVERANTETSTMSERRVKLWQRAGFRWVSGPIFKAIPVRDARSVGLARRARIALRLAEVRSALGVAGVKGN